PAALPVPQVEPRPDLLGYTFVRFGLEDVGDVSFPGRGGLSVLGAAVDPLDVDVEPLLAREFGHLVPPFGSASRAPVKHGAPTRTSRTIAGPAGRTLSVPAQEDRDEPQQVEGGVRD